METVAKFERENAEGNLENKFREYFPDGKLILLKSENIPPNVKEAFENKSKLFLNWRNYKPNNFEAFFEISHSNGSKSYVAEQIKAYDTNQDTERLTYIYDVDGEKISGYAELRYKLRYNISNKSKYFKNKPFVGYNDTEKPYQRKGLGWRRMRLLNAFAQIRCNAPLYSDTLLSESAEGLWKKLVKVGKAKKIKEGELDRYVLTNWQL